MQKKISILNVQIDHVSMLDALKYISAMLKDGGRHQVVTPNPEHLVIAQEDDEFRRIINSADLAVPDGIGLIWASKLQRFFAGKNKTDSAVLSERVTGTDLMIQLCKLAARQGWRVYLLGGQPGIAQEAARILQARYPNLTIVGTSAADPLDNFVLQEIPRDVDLLFVAYGAPTQEKWIAQHLHQLSAKVAIGVGGAFDFIVGKQRRAPEILRRFGAEWLWRLLMQPWRWKRQTRLVKFVWLVVQSLYVHR